MREAQANADSWPAKRLSLITPRFSHASQGTVCLAKKLVTHLVNPASLDAENVLVDLDDLPVLQDGLVVRLERPQVDGHEERRGEDGPHRHLGLALLVAQAEVANDQLESSE